MEEYKAPKLPLENLQKRYFEEDWSNLPVYGSNLPLSVINSDYFNYGNLGTLIRFVQIALMLSAPKIPSLGLSGLKGLSGLSGLV